MMRQLKPWAYGPFEILLHAALHYRVGEDFDRRIAMIGFDNAIRGGNHHLPEPPPHSARQPAVFKRRCGAVAEQLSHETWLLLSGVRHSSGQRRRPVR